MSKSLTWRYSHLFTCRCYRGLSRLHMTSTCVLCSRKDSTFSSLKAVCWTVGPAGLRQWFSNGLISQEKVFSKQTLRICPGPFVKEAASWWHLLCWEHPQSSSLRKTESNVRAEKRLAVGLWRFLVIFAFNTWAGLPCTSWKWLQFKVVFSFKASALVGEVPDRSGYGGRMERHFEWSTQA